MFRHPSAQTCNEQRMSDQANRLLQTAREPIHRIRLACLARGATGILEFGRVFRRFDNDASGSLKMDEFTQGVQECGLNLTDEEMSELFAQFDADNSGSVDYNEFLRAIRPPLNQHRLSLIDLAFTKLDATKDGKIEIDDLKHHYNVHNHPDYLNGKRTEEEILKDFLAKFEQGGIIDGVITKEEFIDYYSGLSASIDNDMYFDLIMRQAWKL
ncbi:calcyphosin-like protein isoform X2 [Brevipalpus obovatus]